MNSGPYKLCDRCSERLTPRGGLPPRFCPRCGRRLAPPSHSTGPDSNGVASSRVCGPAVASLVLAVVGLPLLCFPFGLLAIVLGVYARTRIEESGGRLWGNGLAVAGIIVGVLSSGLWLAFCASVI